MAAAKPSQHAVSAATATEPPREVAADPESAKPESMTSTDTQVATSAAATPAVPEGTDAAGAGVEAASSAKSEVADANQGDESVGSWPRVHAFNMLRLIFEEKPLANDTVPFLAEGALCVKSAVSKREPATGSAAASGTSKGALSVSGSVPRVNQWMSGFGSLGLAFPHQSHLLQGGICINGNGDLLPGIWIGDQGMCAVHVRPLEPANVHTTRQNMTSVLQGF